LYINDLAFKVTPIFTHGTTPVVADSVIPITDDNLIKLITSGKMFSITFNTSNQYGSATAINCYANINAFVGGIYDRNNPKLFAFRVNYNSTTNVFTLNIAGTTDTLYLQSIVVRD